MEEQRICLACPDRPVFTSKPTAYIHAAKAHPLLLDEAHPDELFEVHTVPQAESKPVLGPFYCLFEDCKQERTQRDSIEAHVRATHSVPYGEEEHGVHYVSQEEKERREQWAERENDRHVFAFRLRLESVRGVADFLTECRA